MVYADFDFYKNEYYGQTISQDDFQRLALRASAFLDYCTMGRTKHHADMEEVKMACCALAEEYKAIDTAMALANNSLSFALESSGASEEMQSETVGSWSQSYRSGGDTALSAQKAANSAKEGLMGIVAQYLANTGLLRARGYYA